MENFEIALDWANRPIISVILGILVGILILFVGRWLARVITRLGDLEHINPKVIAILIE